MPQTISILCIDDEPLFLDAFKARLGQEKDLVITTTSSASEALNLLNNQYFDVIISDFAMPEMDGLALLKEIRARGSQSVFIMATAKRLAHIARDALNTGADYYLQKGADMPNEIARLIEFIRVRVPQKNAEYQLIAWARFYNSILDNGTELICRIKPEGTFIFVNDPSTHFFKKTYRQLIQENFFSSIPEVDRKDVMSILQSLTPEKPDCLLQHNIIDGDSKIHNLEWAYHAFFNQSGVQEYQMMGRDTSNRLKIGKDTIADIKRNIPKSSENQIGIAETKGDDKDNIVVTLQKLETPAFATDTSGTIIAWNEKLAHLTGFSATDMINKGGQEYAVPFYGKPGPMLIDHVIRSPENVRSHDVPKCAKVGDTFIGMKEHVTIQGKLMILRGRASPVRNVNGQIIAGIESITVSEVSNHERTNSENYLGGISSQTLKIGNSGVGGSIAGAIGSATGGYGVYATSHRIFVIHNPELELNNSQGVQFSTFLMDEFFGNSPDTRQKTIKELESTPIFVSNINEISKIILKKPLLLSGYLDIQKKDGSGIRVFIDHKKTSTYIENLMKDFAPALLIFE